MMAIETPDSLDSAAENTEPAPSAPPERDSAPSLWVSFLAAVQFLTVLPPIIKRPFTASELGHATAFYPLVGLLLGGLLLAADSLLGWLFPLWVRSALVLVIWVAATGALHLDGFLDTCDGLLGGFTPERRLEIMRDERVGAYALAGGILLYLVKFTAIVSSLHRLPALLLAPLLGRWGITLAIALFPYARPSGLGRQIKDHSGRKQALTAALIALPTALAFGSWRGGVAFILAALVVWLFAGYTLKRIPGLTGDIYGAVNELVETAVLLVYAVSPHL